MATNSPQLDTFGNPINTPGIPAPGSMPTGSEGPGGFNGQAQNPNNTPQLLSPTVQPDTSTSDQVAQWYKQYLGRAPESSTTVSNWMTQTPTTTEQGIKNSPEALAYATNGGAPPPPAANSLGVTGVPNPVTSNTSNLTGQGQSQDLLNTLLGRANQSLNIDPNTDPVIRPQVDNYAATQERSRRNAIDQQAESGNPYSTGALQNERTQATEVAGQSTAGLQSQLTQNELTARRQEIQNALTESGSLLTSAQQMSLQQELALLNGALSQQQINSGNDQFAATLGLNANNQANYWNAISSGLI